jgi:hypothetical protein
MLELLSGMFESTEYNTDLYWDTYEAIVIYFIRVVCCHGNAEQIETWTATIASTDYFSGNRPSENDTPDGLDGKLQSLKKMLNGCLGNCLHQASIAQDLKDQLMMPLGPKIKFVKEIWTSRLGELTAPSDNGTRTPDEILAYSPGVSESAHTSDDSELHMPVTIAYSPGVSESTHTSDDSEPSQDSRTPLVRSKVSEEKTNRTVNHPVEVLQHRTENPTMADLRTPSDSKTPEPTSRIFSESSRNKEHLIQSGIYLTLLINVRAGAT